jgi:hypothetical protein
VKRILLITAAAFAVGLTLDLVLDRAYPGLTAALGFGGCLAIVLGSKWLGHSLLQRPETYYTEPEPEAVEGLDPEREVGRG